VLNLAYDPSPLYDLTVEQIKQKLYTPSNLLAPDEQRLPIKLVHVNKCPVLAPAKTLTTENAQRLKIDRKQCLANLQLIRTRESLLPKLQELYAIDDQQPEQDPEHALYSGGFFSSTDKSLMDKVVNASVDELTELTLPFEDPRLRTLLFRYRARNAPQSLSQSELEKWQRYRQFKLTDPASNASITLSEFMLQLEQLGTEYANYPEKLAILKSLYSYANNL
jgi:exodeoxyribonuclease-1